MASRRVGADRPMSQVPELVYSFQITAEKTVLKGKGSLLQGLGLWRQKRLSELRKAKNLEQRGFPPCITRAMLPEWPFQLRDCQVWASGGRKKTGRDLTDVWMAEGFRERIMYRNFWAEACRGGGPTAESTVPSAARREGSSE